jgi:hypothetical protein
MAILTSYGTQWGFLPETAGKIHWVAPGATYTVAGLSYSASDQNDGLSPEKALRTIAQAITNATASAGEVIVLLPGTHTITASLAMSKAGITITGLPAGKGNIFRQKTVIDITGTADELMNVTAADIEVANLNLIGTTAQVCIDFSVAAHGLHIHDCYFDMATPAASTSTIAIKQIGTSGTVSGAANVKIAQCTFESDGAQGPAISMEGTLRSVIEDCVYIHTNGTWAIANQFGALSNDIIVRRCNMISTGTAISIGFDGSGITTASAVLFLDNRFSSKVTKGVDTFGATTAELAENYVMQLGSGGTAGGTLLLAIT